MFPGVMVCSAAFTSSSRYQKVLWLGSQQGFQFPAWLMIFSLGSAALVLSLSGLVLGARYPIWECGDDDTVFLHLDLSSWLPLAVALFDL